MFFEVFCYYTQKDWSKIEDILKNFDEKITIITTNEELNSFLIKKGFSAYIISEKFLVNSKLEHEMQIKSKIHLEQYRDAFTQIKYKNIEIFNGVESYILDQIYVLEKTKLLLEKKLNFIFIFEYFLHTFFGMKKIAIDLNYITDNNIRIVNKNKIKIIRPESSQKILYLKNFVFFRLLKYLPSNKIWNPRQTTITNENEKIPLITSFKSIGYFKKYIVKKFFRIAKINIFSFFYNILNDFGLDTNKIILKKINKKLVKELSQNLNSKNEKKNNFRNLGTRYCFFLTTNDVDLYLKPIYPILDTFKKRNVKFVIFTIDNTTSSVLKDKKISFIDIFEEMYILSKILKKSPSCEKLIQKIKKIGDENKLILFNSEIPDKIWDKLFETFSVIQICDSIFSKNKINSIFSQIDGNLFGNVAGATAKKFGIPSFTILSSIISEQLNNTRYYRADNILLYGKQAYDTLKKLGYDEKRLIITGNPSYDFFSQINHNDSKIFLNDNYHIDKSKKLIVIAMSRWHQNDELWISNFIQFCHNNNFEIVIKIHPMYQFSDRLKNEAKISKIKSMCKKIRFLITYDIDLYLFISASDLVITEYSNVGPEAIFMGKPVLTVNFSKENWEGEEQYHISGGTIYFEDYLKMEQTVKEILNDGKHLDYLVKGKKKIIDLYNSYNDGEASERIFNLITDSKNNN